MIQTGDMKIKKNVMMTRGGNNHAQRHKLLQEVVRRNNGQGPRVSF